MYVCACVKAREASRGQLCGTGLSYLYMDSRNRTQVTRFCFCPLTRVPPPRQVTNTALCRQNREHHGNGTTFLYRGGEEKPPGTEDLRLTARDPVPEKVVRVSHGHEKEVLVILSRAPRVFQLGKMVAASCSAPCAPHS